MRAVQSTLCAVTVPYRTLPVSALLAAQQARARVRVSWVQRPHPKCHTRVVALAVVGCCPRLVTLRARSAERGRLRLWARVGQAVAPCQLAASLRADVVAQLGGAEAFAWWGVRVHVPSRFVSAGIPQSFTFEHPSLYHPHHMQLWFCICTVADVTHRGSSEAPPVPHTPCTMAVAARRPSCAASEP